MVTDTSEKVRSHESADAAVNGNILNMLTERGTIIIIMSVSATPTTEISANELTGYNTFLYPIHALLGS